MSRTYPDMSARDRMIRDFERAFETMKQVVRARASGELPDTYPFNIEVPTSIVPPPFEAAVADLKGSLHAAVSLMVQLEELLDQAYSASFRAQLAAALLPNSASVEPKLDTLTKMFVKASESGLRAARIQLREILSTAKLQHKLSRDWDEETRRLLRVLFASAHKRHASNPGEPAGD